MAIHRGVSLYSYQQTQFFKKLDWQSQIREVRESLDTDGIEIIDEQLIPGYPFESREFLYAWHSTMARYGMKAVTMDIYLDVHQFRDHVMNHREAAERLKDDIRRAARMGFQNVRCLCLVPIDVIEMALPTAEKYNVRIGKEIHAPLPIKPGRGTSMPNGMNARMADEICELVDRTGSKHLGLVPDFGIFQYAPTELAVAYYKRKMDPAIVDGILERSAAGMAKDDILDWLNKDYAGRHCLNFMSLGALAFDGMSAQPSDIADITPYIISIHGKFYHMTEIPGRPGCYEDKAIDYETPIRFLKQAGFDGYIDSEFEGQRYCQDIGYEGLINEVEQVRRHHEMLTRLIREA